MDINLLIYNGATGGAAGRSIDEMEWRGAA